VLEVLDEGVPVTVIALRYGLARQTVHQWLRRYANEGGLGGLADLAEAGLVPAADARCGGGAGSGGAAEASGWGPSRIRWQLEREGVAPLPRAVGCVPGAAASWPGRWQEAQAASGGLPPVEARADPPILF
jgi:hypothetical protein